MKPEDKARLEAIVADVRRDPGPTQAILLRIIDEQAAEIAKLWAEGNAAGAALVELRGEMVEVEAQLAEEREKREATAGLARNLRTQLNAAEEGRTIAEERADKAERELAEERASWRKGRFSCACQISEEGSRGTASQAAATLKPCGLHGVWADKRAEKAEARVADLQALVDAVAAIGCGRGAIPCMGPACIVSRARDLAKKEPTR